MSFEAQRDLLNETENALIKRRNSTTDPAEKAVLIEQIQEIRDLRDFAAFDSLMETVATLNDLASVIEEAAGALKKQPFDGILGAYQSLLNKIGLTTGKIIALEKPQSATEPPAQRDQGRPDEAEKPAVAAAEAEAAGDTAKRLAKMFDECLIRDANLAEIDHFYVKPLVKNRSIYQQVGLKLQIPWWFVGLIHGLEGAFSLSTHLHNGNSLSERTVDEPKNRPELGTPPFSWIESADDALRLKNLDNQADWSIGTVLNRLEEYNGLGYRNRGLPSPYLWSFSEHYVKGKFVADHVFDPEKVSKQCGAATLLRRLQDKGLIDLAAPLDSEFGGTATTNVSVLPRGIGLGEANQPDLPDSAAKWAKLELDFPGDIADGLKDTRTQRTVHRVQEWCCFHECKTAIDGDYGAGTAMAVKEFQRKSGLPENGVVGELTWAALTKPLRQALAPVQVLPGETIYDVVLKVANQHLKLHPIEFTVSGDSNRGPWVRLYMHGKEGENQAWCAGFVSHVIAQAAHAMGEAAPFKRQVGVDQLVADAKDDGRFLAEANLSTAAQRTGKIRNGCLFVVRNTATDWTHVGIVTEVGADAFKTVEGNTNDMGSRDGFEVCARSRAYKGRDFILLV